MHKNSDVLIVIPARYHSTRLPGKPLALIKGKPMLLWVWEIAQQVILPNVSIDTVVATEDQRIVDFCQSQDMPVVLTSDQCESGTARVRETVDKLDHQASFVVNLQGDNALCPWWFVQALIKAHTQQSHIEQVITPYVTLDWEALDTLREVKAQTPFSGTCVVCDHQDYALWFSKQIIPAIRNEAKYREQPFSPVRRHIGLYGYHRSVLERLPQLHVSPYEALEGLEQLAFIENKIPVKMVEVDYQGRQGMSGIDSPEDIQRAEAILDQVSSASSQ